MVSCSRERAPGLSNRNLRWNRFESSLRGRGKIQCLPGDDGRTHRSHRVGGHQNLQGLQDRQRRCRSLPSWAGEPHKDHPSRAGVGGHRQTSSRLPPPNKPRSGLTPCTGPTGASAGPRPATEPWGGGCIDCVRAPGRVEVEKTAPLQRALRRSNVRVTEVLQPSNHCRGWFPLRFRKPSL
jgi:hypothetical protein